MSGLDYESAFTKFKDILKINWMEKVLLFPPTSLDYIRSNNEKLIACNNFYINIDDEAILHNKRHLFKYRYPHNSIFNLKILKDFKKYINKYDYRDRNMYHRVYNDQVINDVNIWYSVGILDTTQINNIYYDYVSMSMPNYMHIVYKYNSCYEQYDALLDIALRRNIIDMNVPKLLDDIEHTLLLLCVGVSVMLWIIYILNKLQFNLMHIKKYERLMCYQGKLVKYLESHLHKTWKRLQFIESLIGK